MPRRETETEIAETLNDQGFKVEKVEQFRGLPIVKVTFGTPDDVKRALESQGIQIGFEMASCEPFDKFRIRPRSHFHQCRK